MRSPASLSVLSVEDDDDSREMLGVYLRSLGLEVNLAASAEEALRYIQNRDFDLYVLDTWLPELDGYELCRRLRQRSPRGSQIIFFSGAAREVDRQKGIEAGANAYVSKPNFEELANTIDNFIAKAKTLELEVTTRRPQFCLACQAI
jgi:CheY-like chemotaxis protein